MATKIIVDKKQWDDIFDHLKLTLETRLPKTDDPIQLVIYELMVAKSKLEDSL